MSLAKLTIAHEEDVEWVPSEIPIKALFNPHDLSFSRTATWSGEALAAKGGTVLPLEFESRGRETLSLDLLFDTTEAHPSSPLSGVPPVSVKTYTDQIAGLAAIKPDLGRPPICWLTWGGAVFTGVLVSVSWQFTLFREDGTPLRATMRCSFLEHEIGGGTPGELQSAERQITVQAGDSLTAIAQREYGDARKWRLVALRNGIYKPHPLEPGRPLWLPNLGARGGGA